jgi:hypothetical protein
MRDQISMIESCDLATVCGGTELPKTRENMFADAIRDQSSGYADVLVGNTTFSGEKASASVQFRKFDGRRYDSTCTSQHVIAGRFGDPSIDPVNCTTPKLAR